MQTFDASSMMYAWDNYPPGQFPGLWEWMGKQIELEEFVMSEVAFEEVDRKMPDCANWLKKRAIERLPVINDTFQNAMMIKDLLGIKNDQFHNDGVNEKDIFIIASAKEHDQELVSNENPQNNLPSNMKRYKIPAVCSLTQVAVTCHNFLDIIKRSGEVFR